MSYTVTASINQELIKTEGLKPIDMYVLNASLSGADYLYYANYNNDIYGYSLNDNGAVVATETVYTGFPIERSEIKSDVTGEITSINVSIPNVDRAIESVIQNYDYLRGRQIYLITTFTNYLPSGSTVYHIGTTPSKNCVIKEKLYIDSATSNNQVVTFVCKPKFALNNAILPNRKFSKECQWSYLATECDPTNAINTASYPTCNYTLEQCRERGNSKRIGAFPSIPTKGYIKL